MACKNGVCTLNPQNQPPMQQAPKPRGKLGQFFLGTEGQHGQVPLLSAEQVGLQNQLLTQSPQLLSTLSALLKSGPQKYKTTQQPFQFNFAPIEQQARTQFAQKTIPSIAERFTSMDGQRSSAFRQSLGQAGAGLEEALAALRSQYGIQETELGQRQQQLNQNEQQLLNQMFGQRASLGTSLLSNMLSGGFGQQFQPTYTPPQPGLFQAVAPGVGQAGGGLLATLLGKLIGV